MARVTQRHIAELAGVSQVAVSHVLHQPHSARIGEETRREILRIAERLDYQPRNRTTRVIGLVIPVEEFQLEGETNFLVLIDQALRARGFRLLLAGVPTHELQSLREVLSPKSVDGAIFTRWYDGRIKDYVRPEIPWVVTTDEDGIDDTVDQITMDTVQTMSNITRYLLSHGHRRIGLLSGAGGIGFHERLKRGLLDTLSAAGIASDHATFIETEPDDELVVPLLSHLGRPDAPTALITSSPEKASALLNLLPTAGYRVPHDISVVSIGDSPRFRPLRPRLTATTAQSEEVAAGAVERLLEKIKQPAMPPRRRFIAGQVIERESVGPARVSPAS